MSADNDDTDDRSSAEVFEFINFLKEKISIQCMHSSKPTQRQFLSLKLKLISSLALNYEDYDFLVEKSIHVDFSVRLAKAIFQVTSIDIIHHGWPCLKIACRFTVRIYHRKNLEFQYYLLFTLYAHLNKKLTENHQYVYKKHTTHLQAKLSREQVVSVALK